VVVVTLFELEIRFQIYLPPRLTSALLIICGAPPPGSNPANCPLEVIRSLSVALVNPPPPADCPT